MPPIQQAILLVRAAKDHWSAEFTAMTDRIPTQDAEEMLRWFSGERSRQAIRPGIETFLFHPLPSGRFVLAKTCPNRGSLLEIFDAKTTYNVHLMIVAPETLLQFANNPVTLCRKLDEIGAWLSPEKRWETLQSFSVETGGAMLDYRLLDRLTDQIGAESLVSLLQSVTGSVCTFFAADQPRLDVIEGIISLLPVDWRPELSFSTELHFSLEHPLKLIGLSAPVADIGLPLCDLRFRAGRRLPPLDPWSMFVLQILRRKAFEQLESFLTRDFLRLDQLGRTENTGMPTDLDTLGHRGLEQFASRSVADWPAIAADSKALMTPISTGVHLIERPRESPSISRTRRFPHLETDIMLIESYAARAFFGDERALVSLRRHWGRLMAELPWYDRCELSNDYVALTRDMMTAATTHDELKEPRRTLFALDVLDVFLSDPRG